MSKFKDHLISLKEEREKEFIKLEDSKVEIKSVTQIELPPFQSNDWEMDDDSNENQNG